MTATSIPELATILTILTAIAGTIVTILRYGPERKGVLIREEEGSFNIINSLTHTLQTEVTRLNVENGELRARVLERDARVLALEEENAGLRDIAGRRRDDPTTSGP